ncbi:MAG: FecR domain-containing protein [Pseudomonadota bacterium]
MTSSAIKLLLHSFLILFLLFSVQAAQANTGKAFTIVGTATVNDEVLTLGTVLKEGDRIVTGEKSSVRVVMKDGTVIDIQENSGLTISQYAYKEDAPEESSSAFSILGGAVRYISGLIAKKDPNKVKLTAGTATIGIRGTFVNVDTGWNVSAAIDSTGFGTLAVQTSVGEASVTLPDGSTLNVVAGNIGTINTSTGATSTAAAPPDPIAAAAIAMASNPAGAAAAIATMSDADAALAIAALVNNATQLGATKEAVLAAVQTAVASKPSAAVGTAYITSALSPADAATFATAIKAAAPDQAAAIDAASGSGSTLDPAPATGTTFNLREGADGDVIVTLEDGTEVTIENNNPGGTPLTTEQIQEQLEILTSGS